MPPYGQPPLYYPQSPPPYSQPPPYQAPSPPPPPPPPPPFTPQGSPSPAAAAPAWQGMINFEVVQPNGQATSTLMPAGTPRDAVIAAAEAQWKASPPAGGSGSGCGCTDAAPDGSYTCAQQVGWKSCISAPLAWLRARAIVRSMRCSGCRNVGILGTQLTGMHLDAGRLWEVRRGLHDSNFVGSSIWLVCCDMPPLHAVLRQCLILPARGQNLALYLQLCRLLKFRKEGGLYISTSIRLPSWTGWGSHALS